MTAVTGRYTWPAPSPADTARALAGIDGDIRRGLPPKLDDALIVLAAVRAADASPDPDEPIPFARTPKAHATLANPPGGFPPIVCLCGSTRFVEEFNRQRRELTEHGQIVLAIEVVTTQARQDDPQHADPALKARLDELHKRKIDLADYVLILNVGGYTGPSTRAEIAYAAALGKPVRYLEPPAGPEPVTGSQWACLHCGAAFFGTAPEARLCPACRPADGEP
jgi:hypothetical protein